MFIIIFISNGFALSTSLNTNLNLDGTFPLKTSKGDGTNDP